MDFLNYILEDIESHYIDYEHIQKFKSTFGNSSFVIKGFKFKFSNHAMQRYIERNSNDSKMQLLDQLKKVESSLFDKADNTYHIKIKSINTGFIIKKNDKIFNVITVYGNEMVNMRKSTIDIIIESILDDAIFIEIE